MNKIILTILTIIICLTITNIAIAYNGDLCNETHSPCGGGCNSTDLDSMFSGVIDFDAVVGDITGWNTSCITSMFELFGYSDFNQNIGGWDTSSVTSMSDMFNSAVNFNQPIGSWDVSQVTDMSAMFDGALSFNQDISGWDTSNVILMPQMFRETPFNQDLSLWNITSVTDMSVMFSIVTLSTTNYDALLNGWASQTPQSSVAFGGGYSRYSSTGLVGRDILTTNYSWTITDAGFIDVAPIAYFSFDNGGNLTNQVGNAFWSDMTSTDEESTIITGVSGDGIHCDGTHLRINGSMTDLLADAATVNMWFKSTNSDMSSLIWSYVGDDYFQLLINYVVSGDMGADNAVGGFLTTTATSPVLNDGSWHMLTFVKNGIGGMHNVSIYVDKVLQNLSTNGAGADDDNLPAFAGFCARASLDYPVTADIDEIKMWDRALSDLEIIALYEQDEVLCVDDGDCGFCQKCDAGICINQTNTEDLKNECETAYTGCLNDYTLQGDSGNCDGTGACLINNIFQNVTEGQVCLAGLDTQPTNSVYCNELYDCINATAQADGYWTGYAGDGTSTCSDLNWIANNNTWNATINWTINVTEHATVCQEAPIPCVENWTCNSFANCNIHNITTCLSITDNNVCGNPFTGNLTDYDAICTYTPITYTDPNDITKIIIDFFGRTLIGFKAVAGMIGILLALIAGLFVYNKIIKKK